MQRNLLATLTTIGIVTIDQLIKYRAILLKDIFISTRFPWLTLHTSINQGVAFSLPFPRILLIILSFGIMGFVLWWWQKQEKHTQGAAVGLGLFLGGAFGNLFDRLFREGVIDYLNISNGSFNLADGAIIFGILLLLLSRRRLAKNA